MAASQVGGTSLGALSCPVGAVKQHKTENELIFAFLLRPGWMEPPDLERGTSAHARGWNGMGFRAFNPNHAGILISCPHLAEGLHA